MVLPSGETTPWPFELPPANFQTWSNNRKDASGELMEDADRFDLAVRQIVGKRLTWDRLTAWIALKARLAGIDQEVPPTSVIAPVAQLANIPPNRRALWDDLRDAQAI